MPEPYEWAQQIVCSLTKTHNKLFYMKKKYFSPLVIVDIAEVEHNFLNSERAGSQAPDLIYDDEVDPW